MLARFTVILLIALLGTSLLTSRTSPAGLCEVDKVVCAQFLDQPLPQVSHADWIPDQSKSVDWGSYDFAPDAIPALIILIITTFIFGFIAPAMDLAQVWYRVTSFIHRLCHTLVPTLLVVFIRLTPRILPTWTEDIALPHFARLTVLRRMGSVTAA